MSEKLTHPQYWLARREHAYVLWLEGLTLREIGPRLGISHERARQMIWQFKRAFARSLMRKRFRFEVEVTR